MMFATTTFEISQRRQVVIFGTGDYARTAAIYLREDSAFEVVAFTVDSERIEIDELRAFRSYRSQSWSTCTRRPSTPCSSRSGSAASTRRAPRCTSVARSADTSSSRTSTRARPAWGNLELGDNCFVFEENVIQPNVRIGNDVVLWSGNHVGHDSEIGDHCFIASHVVISGNVRIGPYCFVGVNATLRDGITIAPECVIGAGALVMRDTERGEIYSCGGRSPRRRSGAGTSTCEHSRVVRQPVPPDAGEGVTIAVGRSDEQWLDRVVESVSSSGLAIVEGVLDDALIEECRSAMYAVQKRIQSDVGIERFDAAGEVGVLRLMLRYDDFFFRLLELPEVLDVVDATVSETAILHLQNGLILPPIAGDAPDVFQTRYHRDFPRVLKGYLMSINLFFALDEFNARSGGTRFVPGTHQAEERPSDAYLEAAGITATCSPGSMIVFDSTVWHAAGANRTGRDRLAVNQQFTRSYVKQQIDYVRALGDEMVKAQAPRTQQLLGWYTRVVTSLDEFYRPADERLYRSGQG